MELEQAAVSRQQLRAKRWNLLVEAFKALGSEADEQDFISQGLAGARDTDGSVYRLRFGPVLVTFTLIYVSDSIGRVVCTTAHPFDADQQVHLFKFALSEGGATSFKNPQGEFLDLAPNSHIVLAMGMEAAVEYRATAMPAVNA